MRILDKILGREPPPRPSQTNILDASAPRLGPSTAADGTVSGQDQFNTRSSSTAGVVGAQSANVAVVELAEKLNLNPRELRRYEEITTLLDQRVKNVLREQRARLVAGDVYSEIVGASVPTITVPVRVRISGHRGQRDQNIVITKINPW